MEKPLCKSVLCEVSKLEGLPLAYAVGIAEDLKIETWHSKSVAVLFQGAPRAVPWNPHTDWVQGGPIIEREKINTVFGTHELWSSTKNDLGAKRLEDSFKFRQYGPTPLIAAMRCYVASKLGEHVEIPEELLNV